MNEAFVQPTAGRVQIIGFGRRLVQVTVTEPSSIQSIAGNQADIVVAHGTVLRLRDAERSIVELNLEEGFVVAITVVKDVNMAQFVNGISTITSEESPSWIAMTLVSGS